jgi:hypothetical protein
MSAHPFQAIYDAIARAWAAAENEGHYPVREIDLITALRSDEAMLAMAMEVADARTILAEKRVHRAWRWFTVALILALAGETVLLAAHFA